MHEVLGSSLHLMGGPQLKRQNGAQVDGEGGDGCLGEKDNISFIML